MNVAFWYSIYTKDVPYVSHDIGRIAHLQVSMICSFFFFFI